MLKTKTKVATTKMMVFGVGDLYLGILLEEIQKVIDLPKIHKGGNPCLGITQVNDREIVALDLHQTIYGTSPSRDKGYFIITQSTDVLYGLTSANLPTMAEVPVADLRPVPAAYRDRDTLRIANQMVQVTLDKIKTSTVFLLDPNCLADLVQQFDQNALQAEYKTLMSLDCPVDALKLPVPTIADPWLVEPLQADSQEQ
jgi:purine-binding chemotaxis protein CheW